MPQANIPYGNAYLVSTPKADRYENMVVQDQRNRDLQEQRSAQLLDQEFSKNASLIRDIDVPLAYQSYQEYKNIGKQLYKFDKKLSDADRIQLQLKKQRAASNYFGLVNKSKELKDVEDAGQKGYMKDPYKFDADAPNYLTYSRNTPISQHPGFEDVVNNIQLKNKDFSKDVVAAMGGISGKPLKINTLKKVSPDGLMTTPTDVLAYNSPSQFAATLIEKMPDPRSKTAFVNQHSYNDLAAQDLLTRYEALRQTDAFKNAYPNEPAINTDALNDPYTKAITLTSIDHILRHPPTLVEGRSYKNEDAFLNNQQEYKTGERLAHESFTSYQNRVKEAGRNARTEKLVAAYKIPDYYNDILNDKPMQDADAKKNGYSLRDVTDLSPEQEDILFGTRDEHYQRKHEPIEIQGRKYLKVKNWKILDANDKPIDRNFVVGATNAKLKGSKEAEAKGKMETETTSKQPPKNKGNVR